MGDIEGTIDIGNAPYRAIIRIRTKLEFDRVILSIAGRIASTMVSAKIAEQLAPVATKVLTSASIASKKLGAEQPPLPERVVAAMRVVANWEDAWCPTRPWPWPGPWPGPWPWPWKDIIKPQPDPWSESGLFDIPALIAVIGLAELTEQGVEIAKAGQTLLDNLTP